MKFSLDIEDDVFNEIKSEVGFKIMCGNSYGIVDEVLRLIVMKIDKGETEIIIRRKEKVKKENKT